MPDIRLIARLDARAPHFIESIRLEEVRVIGDPSEHARACYRRNIAELPCNCPASHGREPHGSAGRIKKEKKKIDRTRTPR